MIDNHYRRACAESLYRTLAEDAFYRTMKASLAGDEAASEEGMIQYMAYAMSEAERFGELSLLPGEPIGAAVWSKPLDPGNRAARAAAKKTFLRRHLGEKSLETYRAMVDFMAEKTGRVTDDTSWYLSIVGVCPGCRGKGLGAALIEPVLRKTDQLGVGTFLETFTRRNMGFYTRLGYTAAASFFEPTAKAEYWVMTRDCR